MRAAERQRGGADPALRWVLGAIAAASLLLGGFSYARYRQAEVELRGALVNLRQQGAQLDAEGCIEAGLQWTRRCNALLDLCNASVSRVVNACLQARDRRAECRSFGRSLEDARVVFRRCAKHGAEGRRGHKNCVEAYRMLAATCREGDGQS